MSPRVKTAQIPGHFIQCDSKDYPFTVGNIAGTIPHYYIGLQVIAGRVKANCTYSYCTRGLR
jgi:hypothetical protein